MTTVSITQDHITRGTRGNKGCCPIALALQEYIPDTYNVSVMYTAAHIIDRELSSYRTLLLGDRARSFIADYDKGLSVSPFDMELNIELPSSIDNGRQFDTPARHWSEDDSPSDLFPIHTREK